MLIAFLRGLLPSTLPMGRASHLKEQLVLSALSCELDASIMTTEFKLEASLVTTPDTRWLHEFAQRVEGLRGLLEFDRKAPNKHQDARDKFVKLFKLLQEKGVLQKLKDSETRCKQVILHH